MESGSVTVKTKYERRITAILLAVFLGPWTWIYTFQRNSLKAAIGLAINSTTLVFLVFLFLSIAQQAAITTNVPFNMRPTDSLNMLAFSVLVIFCSFFWFFIWVWALVDTVSGKQSSPNLASPNTFYSLLLAVFLGPWTWLYSYTRDWWKFWLAVLIGYTSLYFSLVGFSGLDNLDKTLRLNIFLSLISGIWLTSISLSAARHVKFRRIRKPPAVSPQKNTGKNKTTSIMLAVFFSIFTWLYTYQRDAWKFWAGLLPWILVIVFNIFSLPWNIAVTGVVGSGIWLWSIVDALRKTGPWYQTYPGERWDRGKTA